MMQMTLAFYCPIEPRSKREAILSIGREIKREIRKRVRRYMCAGTCGLKLTREQLYSEDGDNVYCKQCTLALYAA
jgi:hypothetical protein